MKKQEIKKTKTSPHNTCFWFSFLYFRKILNRKKDCLISGYTRDNLRDVDACPLADSRGKSMWTPWNGTSFRQMILPWRKYETSVMLPFKWHQHKQTDKWRKKSQSSYQCWICGADSSLLGGRKKKSLTDVITVCQIEHHPFVPRPVHIRCTWRCEVISTSLM